MKRPEPENHMNLLLAIVLSMAVMFAWQIFYAGPRLKDEQARQQREREAAQQAAPGAAAPAASPRQAAPGQAPPPGVPAQGRLADRAAVLAAGPRVAIETPSLSGSISLTGGRIDDLALVKYHERPDPKSPKVVLFSPPGAEGAYFAEHGWQSPPGASVKTPDSDAVWRLDQGDALRPGAPVALTWDNGAGLLFRRTISVDADYMFTVADEVENKTPADVALIPYARIYRFGMPRVEGFFIQHEGLIGVPGDAGLKEITYKTALGEGGGETFADKTGGWLGVTDKYWAAAAVPPQGAPYRATLSGRAASGGEQDVFWADYALAPVPVAAGQRAKVEGRLFAGAKQVHIVEGYEDSLGILRFNKLIDWGWFPFFTQPLFYLLDLLYKLFGNFGLAILATTVIVKGLFFPLANKSYESMAKMKKLQPEMEKLKERFKDDKARQQQELMKLYQTQKINPLAGCLPIFLQIPVFFALYKVLFISIDMRHAPFFGWISDLSAPDPTSIVNLFGLLPFAAPDFLHVGVWPLFMGVTMWLQMQLNPPQPDPTQQMIFNWMPVMFTFMLGSFPAGLVIYWTWNNILSVAQQRHIMKSQGVDVALGDNVKRAFAPFAKLPIWRTLGWAPPEPAAASAAGARNPGAPPVKPAEPPPGVMTEEQAFSTLGLAPGASRQEIEAAYKRLIKTARPGAGGSGQGAPGAIGKARDMLLRDGRA